MDTGAWQAMVHGVTESRTRLKRLGTHSCVRESRGRPAASIKLGWEGRMSGQAGIVSHPTHFWVI